VVPRERSVQAGQLEGRRQEVPVLAQLPAAVPRNGHCCPSSGCDDCCAIDDCCANDAEVQNGCSFQPWSKPSEAVI
jgi:hypothetical protein